MVSSYCIYAAILASLVLGRVNRNLDSPPLALANRWLRWAIFAIAAATIWRRMELTTHPFWLLVALFAIIWFLIETLYYWMSVKAISESPMPLFPKYTARDAGEEWPTSQRLRLLRLELRDRLGYKHAQSLRANITGNLHLRISIYHDATATRRLQITFFPRPGAAIAMCASLTTLTAGGLRYITDNIFMPYAGFYPETWRLERRPLIRSLAKLQARHAARLAAAGETPVPWTTDPLDDLNTQQRDLEQLNTRLGFLTPASQRPSEGKITPPGRYRIWKEIWTLNYLGLSARYQ